MPIEIQLLGTDSLDLMDEINGASAAPLVHYSTSYIKFLLELMPAASLRNIAACVDGKVAGFLPLLEQQHGGQVVLNSLPFYGSHGGPCVRADCDASATIQHLLLNEALVFAEKSNALSLVVIENPNSPVQDLPDGMQIIDDRIGQFTRLPGEIADTEDLLTLFHQKTRNAIRKGCRGHYTREVTDESWMRWLQGVHADAIGKLGGRAKENSVFEKLTRHFPLGQSSRLFVGFVDGEPASGLFVLLHGKTVEYFTPVATEAYKNQQVLSALIADVMQILVGEGYNLWNWGGTWHSQQGVYRFKNRFGADDRPYRYLGRVFDAGALQTIKERDPAAYPYFYLYRH